MRKILLQHFPSLDNYGTAMMGLVATQFFHDHFNGDVEIYTEIPSDSVIAEVQSELRAPVNLKFYHHPYQAQFKKIYQRGDRGLHAVRKRLLQLRTLHVYREFDLITILGGDDISEYYSRHGAAAESIRLYLTRRYAPVVLLGQTIGPFRRWVNRQVIRRMLAPIPVITRDAWCTQYLQQEMKLKQNVFQGGDLAFCDLPRQHDKDIEQEILRRYGLVPNQYITVIVSGASAYCKDKTVYLQMWRDIVQNLAAEPALQGRKICLLAHTFSLYGDEGKNIEEVCGMLPPEIRERTVPVKERILPTRARFVLGNGYLTITGRMHASVSTYQMGKPAIALSYSKKYDGVIGQNLNRQDLILNANDSALWKSRRIVDMIGEKVRYICGNYDRLTAEIRDRAAVQKQLAEFALQKCAEFVK